MKAVVLQGERSLGVRDIPPVSLDADGAVLGVEGCAVCIGDADLLYGYGPSIEAPAVLGHEIVGTIIEVGARASEHLKAMLGRRVVLDDNRPCGECKFCRSGQFRYCRSPRYGHISGIQPGKNWGGYAERVTVDSRTVMVPIDDDLPLAVAAFSFPMASGIEWLAYAARMQRGATVAVLGASRMGVATVAAAFHVGASAVTMLGSSSACDAIEAARRLGARIVEPGGAASLEASFDVVVVVTEAPAEFLTVAIDMVGPNGFVIAASTATKAASVVPETVRRKGVAVRGGRGASEAALADAAKATASDPEFFARIPCEMVSLDECGDAILSLMQADRSVRGAYMVVGASVGNGSGEHAAKTSR